MDNVNVNQMEKPITTVVSVLRYVFMAIIAEVKRYKVVKIVNKVDLFQFNC